MVRIFSADKALQIDQDCACLGTVKFQMKSTPPFPWVGGCHEGRFEGNENFFVLCKE